MAGPAPTVEENSETRSEASNHSLINPPQTYSEVFPLRRLRGPQSTAVKGVCLHKNTVQSTLNRSEGFVMPVLMAHAIQRHTTPLSNKSAAFTPKRGELACLEHGACPSSWSLDGEADGIMLRELSRAFKNGSTSKGQAGKVTSISTGSE